MPRHPRLDFPGMPQHIVQRGNDHKACFARELDCLRFRQELTDAARRNGCAVHAYVFMTNHAHLLVTPTEVGGASAKMRALGRRYVGYFNTLREVAARSN